MSFMLLCPRLCCQLGQAVQCELEEGRVGANVMITGKGPLPGPRGCGAPLVGA